MLAAFRRHRGFAREERGAAAVEFALVLVPFLILIFGMIQYSMYFWSTQSSASAVREAARRAAVGDQTCAVFTAAAASNVRLASGAVAAQRKFYAVSDTTFSTPVAAAVGANVKVTISYNSVDLNLPFLPFINNGAVSETAFARVENTTPNSVPCP